MLALLALLKLCCSPYSHQTSFVQIASGSVLVCVFGNALRIRPYALGFGGLFGNFGIAFSVQGYSLWKARGEGCKRVLLLKGTDADVMSSGVCFPFVSLGVMIGKWETHRE